MKQPVLFVYRPLWHALFWISYELYSVWIWGSSNGQYVDALYLEMVDLPLKLIATYWTIYFLLPRFFFQQRYFRFGIWMLATVLSVCVIQRSMEFYVTGPWFFPGRWTEPYWHAPYFFHCLINIYAVVSVATVIKLMKNWYLQQNTLQNLKNEKLRAELNFLKGQIHPHFLFNTLNNLYAHALNQSRQTPQIIEKLSDLLHYMLYDCNSSEVSLQAEVRYLENFIELEKMRFGERLDVSLSLIGDINRRRIPPLLLLPLIENSFKHGVAKSREGGWVDIAIVVTDKKLNMKVSNSVKSPKLSSDEQKGVGLKNLKKRLRLLYEDRYHFALRQSPEIFEVNLQLPLTAAIAVNNEKNILSYN